MSTFNIGDLVTHTDRQGGVTTGRITKVVDQTAWDDPTHVTGTWYGIEGAPNLVSDGITPATPTLNDELAVEAQRVALSAHARLARVGTKHDPEL